MTISAIHKFGIESSAKTTTKRTSSTVFDDLFKKTLSINSAKKPAVASTQSGHAAHVSQVAGETDAASVESRFLDKLARNAVDLPSSVGAAASMADALGARLGKAFGALFAEAGITDRVGLSAVLKDGEFEAFPRLVPNGPPLPIPGIGSGITMADIEEAQNEYKLADLSGKNYFEMLMEKIDSCLLGIKGWYSDELESFALANGIAELAKFNPDFADEYDADPLAAVEKYSGELAMYMEGGMFPVMPGESPLPST